MTTKPTYKFDDHPNPLTLDQVRCRARQLSLDYLRLLAQMTVDERRALDPFVMLHDRTIGLLVQVANVADDDDAALTELLLRRADVLDQILHRAAIPAAAAEADRGALGRPGYVPIIASES